MARTVAPDVVEDVWDGEKNGRDRCRNECGRVKGGRVKGIDDASGFSGYLEGASRKCAVVNINDVQSKRRAKLSTRQGKQDPERRGI